MKPTSLGVKQVVAAVFRGQFKEPSNVLTTSRTKREAATDLETLHCSDCGVRIGVVTDRRFGLMPSGSVCVTCSVPAYRKARRVVSL